MKRAFLLTAVIVAGSASAADGDLRTCLPGLRATAISQGIPGSVFDSATAGVEFDPTVIEASQNQPEFKTPIWDYLAGLVDDERIADGRARLVEWGEVLARAEQQYRVDRATIVAIWGVESDYGRVTGKRQLVRSLATLSCAGSRQAYFRGEFISTLKILHAGDVAPEVLVGSWAGAFGHTQFMPSTFLRLAVDFDGDGRRDLVSSIPDVLGSTANYLARAGWQPGLAWGAEVRVPAGYAGASGRRNKQPYAAWKAAGVTRLDGSPVDGTGQAALLLPAGPKGPAFLVTRNFDAIYSYNAAESYALAIAHLSDRLRGGAPFARPWPTDDAGLSRAQRREVQQALAARGYDVGAPDGVIGPKSREAIKDVEGKAGMAPTGRAGGRLYRLLVGR